MFFKLDPPYVQESL